MGNRSQGLSREEHSEKVDRLRLKETRGEKLTKHEQRILDYANSPCRCNCGVRR